MYTFARLLGNICPSNWHLQEDEWWSIIVIFDINKDPLYTCLHGTVLFINGIVLMGFPSGHSSPVPLLNSIDVADPSTGVDIIHDRSLVCKNKALIQIFAFPSQPFWK